MSRPHSGNISTHSHMAVSMKKQSLEFSPSGHKDTFFIRNKLTKMTLHWWCCQEALTKHKYQRTKTPALNSAWRVWEHSLGLESITALMAHICTDLQLGNRRLHRAYCTSSWSPAWRCSGSQWNRTVKMHSKYRRGGKTVKYSTSTLTKCRCTGLCQLCVRANTLLLRHIPTRSITQQNAPHVPWRTTGSR